MDDGSLVAPVHQLRHGLEMEPRISVLPHALLILSRSDGPVNLVRIPNQGAFQETWRVAQLPQGP